MPPTHRPFPSRELLAAALFSLSSCIAIAQTAPVIPPGVHYKAASPKLNEEAKQAFTRALDSPPPSSFFDSAVTCGPALWRVLKPTATGPLGGSKVVTAIVNHVQAEARALLTGEQKQDLLRTLLSRYPSLHGATLRPATTYEIRYFWATIPFDLEEPFFTAESKDVRLLLNFRVVNGHPRLFWVDLVGDLTKPAADFGSVPDLPALQMTAEAGDPYAMLQLGEAYWAGTSIPADTEKSRLWLDRAAQKGSLDAQVFLGMAYTAGNKVPRDRELAARYLLLAANQGNPLAQYYTGMFYRQGLGVPQSNEIAVSWLQKAAQQGSSVAEFDLGTFYSEGVGVPTDKQHACSLYQQAAQQGHVRAMNNLGQCYQLGQGVDKDPQHALALYTQAAEHGHVLAMDNAAILCGGLGDWPQSYLWLRVAQDRGATQNQQALDNVKLHLTPEQVTVAEARVVVWEKAHPASK